MATNQNDIDNIRLLPQDLRTHFERMVVEAKRKTLYGAIIKWRNRIDNKNTGEFICYFFDSDGGYSSIYLPYDIEVKPPYRHKFINANTITHIDGVAVDKTRYALIAKQG